MIVLLPVSGVAERLAQLAQGVVGLALDGSDAGAQGVGGLLDRWVLEVAQHEHGALAYRQVHYRWQQHLLQQHVRFGWGIAGFDGGTTAITDMRDSDDDDTGTGRPAPEPDGP